MESTRSRKARLAAASNRRSALAAIAALLLATVPIAHNAAQDGPSYSLGGTVEARPFGRYSGGGELDGADVSYGLATRVGLELAVKGSRARAAASIETALLTGAAASDAWAAAALARAEGLDSAGLLLAPAYDSGQGAPPTLLEARVRTLYLKLDYDPLVLTVGRQVVNYLRGALWSPTDPFTELDLSGISPVRRGTDALRLVTSLGATGAFDLVAAPAADFAKGRYAARLSGFLAGIDGALLGYREGAAALNGERGAWSLGADFKADLGLGWNGEALYSRPDSGRSWLRAAGGADYSMGDFVAAAEYYYNGGGAEADPNAPGSHNAYASLTWKASDFLAASASLIDGISEGDWAATLAIFLDAAQNAEIEGYGKLARSGDASSAWLLEAGVDVTVKY